MVHQIAPSAFKMKKGGGHIFQLSLICTLKAIEVIKKVKKRKKDWVIELRQINTLWGRGGDGVSIKYWLLARYQLDTACGLLSNNRDHVGVE